MKNLELGTNRRGHIRRLSTESGDPENYKRQSDFCRSKQFLRR